MSLDFRLIIHNAFRKSDDGWQPRLTMFTLGNKQVRSSFKFTERLKRFYTNEAKNSNKKYEK